MGSPHPAGRVAPEPSPHGSMCQCVRHRAERGGGEAMKKKGKGGKHPMPMPKHPMK